MEIIDLYEDNRLPTGKTSERGENFHPHKNENMQVVHICIFNSKDEMLIQKRQIRKSAWSGYWDVSAGGCSQAGETSKQAAERELFEELGISHDFSNERPYLTMNFRHGFDDYYFLKMELDPSSLTLQESEVSDAKWATKEEILSMIEGDEFVHFVPSFISSLFDLKNISGAIIYE